jgi:O-antigen ligase
MRVTQNKNLFVYDVIRIIGVFLLAVLIFFPYSFGSLLPFLVVVATTIITVGTLEYGIYGPLYFLVILIPYSQSVSIFSLGDREVNLGMHTIVIGYIIIMMSFVKGFKIKKVKEPSTRVLLILGLWTLLTILISLFFRSSGVTNSLVTWVRWIQFIPIVCILISSDIDLKHIKNFVKILIYLGFITSIWGIFEVLNPTELTSRAFRGAVSFTRPLFRELNLASSFQENGFYKGSANYNVSGAFMVVIFFISLPFLKSKSLFSKNRISLLLIMLLIVGIAVTKSRSSIIAFIVGIAFYSYQYSFKRFLNILFLLLFVIVIFFSFFSEYWLGPMIIDTIYKLPSAISVVTLGDGWSSSMDFNTNVYGAAMRFVALKEAFRIFLSSPIFGVGFYGFSSASILGTAENFYMQFLSETGIIGLALLIRYYYYLWRKTKTKFPIGSFEDNFQIGFRSAFIVFLIVNMTGTLMYDTRIWGLMLILGAIQVYNVKMYNKNID